MRGASTSCTSPVPCSSTRARATASPTWASSTPLLERVGPRATLHVHEGGDHSLGMLKRSGRTQDDVLADVAIVTRRWTTRVPAGAGGPR